MAVGVGQALGLHVPRPVQVPLDEALPVPERGGRLADRGLVLLADLVHRAGDLEPAAAAAEGGLDRHRQAVLAGEIHDLFRRVDGAVCTGRQRRADAPGDLPGLDLVAERLDRLRRGPDPGQARVGHRRGEGGVLGEEAVAGVHSVRAGHGRDVDDLADVQVRLRRRAAVERVRLVGDLDVQGVEVLVGVDGHAGQACVPAGASHADRDLAAVRDQDFAQFRLRELKGELRRSWAESRSVLCMAC